MILSPVDCFIQEEVIGFQDLLDSLRPRGTRASRSSSTVLQRESFLVSVSSIIRAMWPNRDKCHAWTKGEVAWLSVSFHHSAHGGTVRLHIGLARLFSQCHTCLLLVCRRRRFVKIRPRPSSHRRIYSTTLLFQERRETGIQGNFCWNPASSGQGEHRPTTNYFTSTLLSLKWCDIAQLFSLF